MEASIEFLGLQNTLAVFRDAPVLFQKKYGPEAVRKAATIIRNQARTNATANFTGGYSTGRIRKFTGNIKLRARQGGPGEITYLVGIGRNSKILEGVKKSGKEPFYWRFMEYGFTTGDGVHHPAEPFLRPAADTTRDQQMSAMSDSLNEAMRAYAQRLARGVQHA